MFGPPQVFMCNHVSCFHETEDAMDALFRPALVHHLCANAFAVYAFDHARKCNIAVPNEQLEAALQEAHAMRHQGNKCKGRRYERQLTSRRMRWQLKEVLTSRRILRRRGRRRCYLPDYCEGLRESSVLTLGGALLLASVRGRGPAAVCARRCLVRLRRQRDVQVRQLRGGGCRGRLCEQALPLHTRARLIGMCSVQGRGYPHAVLKPKTPSL